MIVKSPVIFSLHILLTFPQLSSCFKVILCEDDATCIVEGTDQTQSIKLMEEAQKVLSLWFRANRLQLNEAKTKFMVYSLNNAF